MPPKKANSKSTEEEMKALANNFFEAVKEIRQSFHSKIGELNKRVEELTKLVKTLSEERASCFRAAETTPEAPTDAAQLIEAPHVNKGMIRVADIKDFIAKHRVVTEESDVGSSETIYKELRKRVKACCDSLAEGLIAANKMVDWHDLSQNDKLSLLKAIDEKGEALQLPMRRCMSSWVSTFLPSDAWYNKATYLKAATSRKRYGSIKNIITLITTI
ncbi:hypothetical protein EC973_008403 [Apophysomyces ossiformis]|uniref:Uncharacterized protein n=1 Tax=Apophysomyces ossiformis TaxID=679940 RepID=A0A8H7EQC0_9FUNG|nr:hypothetical protein EC973_008403 [Apophysomyces ossiformis]